MKSEESVTPRQMAALLVVYTTGSSILFTPSTLMAQAGNTFWLAWLAAGACGCLPLAAMLYIRRRFHGQSIIEAGFETVGYVMTVILMIPLLVFMILLQGYIYFSIGAFFTTTMMRETPAYVFNGLIALVAALTVRAGIVVMARMFVLLSIIMIGMIALVLLFDLKNYQLNFLLPVLKDGIRPVFHSVYQTTGFIYGDFLVFSILFAYMRPEQGKTGSKAIAGAFLFNWLVIALISLCSILAFGPMSNEFQYPLFMLSRLISIQEIIERGESIIGMSMMAGSYMKAALMLFALNSALTRLLKLKDDGVLVFPLAMLGFILSLVLVKNEADFAEVLITWPLLTFTVSLTIYLILLIAPFSRKSSKSGK